MEYHQHEQNSCYFSSLDSGLKASNQLAASNAIETRIYSLLTYKIRDRVMFRYAILAGKKN